MLEQHAEYASLLVRHGGAAFGVARGTLPQPSYEPASATAAAPSLVTHHHPATHHGQQHLQHFQVVALGVSDVQSDALLDLSAATTSAAAVAASSLTSSYNNHASLANQHQYHPLHYAAAAGSPASLLVDPLHGGGRGEPMMAAAAVASFVETTGTGGWSSSATGAHSSATTAGGGRVATLAIIVTDLVNPSQGCFVGLLGVTELLKATGAEGKPLSVLVPALLAAVRTTESHVVPSPATTTSLSSTAGGGPTTTTTAPLPPSILYDSLAAEEDRAKQREQQQRVAELLITAVGPIRFRTAVPLHAVHGHQAQTAMLSFIAVTSLRAHQATVVLLGKERQARQELDDQLSHVLQQHGMEGGGRAGAGGKGGDEGKRLNGMTSEAPKVLKPQSLVNPGQRGVKRARGVKIS